MNYELEIFVKAMVMTITVCALIAGLVFGASAFSQSIDKHEFNFKIPTVFIEVR